MLRDVIERSTKVLGSEHENTLESECYLVEALLGQSRYSEAEMVGTQLMIWSEKHSGTSDIVEAAMLFMGRNPYCSKAD